MPYFLVTQTSLVEAKDEVAAAEQVLAKLQTAHQIVFTVKFDENNVRQVTVQKAELLVTRPKPEPISAQGNASVHDSGCVQEVQAHEPESTRRFRVESYTIALTMFIFGAAVGLTGHMLMHW